MKFSVYIATSVDGYIALPDGGVDWLHTAGNPEADMDDEDMGFHAFMDSVDCMIMGRKCMDMIASMNLTQEQWPYGDLRIIVLSKSIQEPPGNLRDKVEIFAGDIHDLVSRLKIEGYKHAYVDGGATITSFLNRKLIDEMIITQVPVLLGEGVPLFGKLDQPIQLKSAQAVAYANDFTQNRYQVCYI